MISNTESQVAKLEQFYAIDPDITGLLVAFEKLKPLPTFFSGFVAFGKLAPLMNKICDVAVSANQYLTEWDFDEITKDSATKKGFQVRLQEIYRAAGASVIALQVTHDQFKRESVKCHLDMPQDGRACCWLSKELLLECADLASQYVESVKDKSVKSLADLLHAGLASVVPRAEVVMETLKTSTNPWNAAALAETFHSKDIKGTSDALGITMCAKDLSTKSFATIASKHMPSKTELAAIAAEVQSCRVASAYVMIFSGLLMPHTTAEEKGVKKAYCDRAYNAVKTQLLLQGLNKEVLDILSKAQKDGCTAVPTIEPKA